MARSTSSAPAPAISSRSAQSLVRSKNALNTARSAQERKGSRWPPKSSQRARAAAASWNAVVSRKTSTGVPSHQRRTWPSRWRRRSCSSVASTGSGRATTTSSARSAGTNTLTSMSIVPRARSVHHARASAPPKAWGSPASASASCTATILPGSPVSAAAIIRARAPGAPARNRGPEAPPQRTSGRPEPREGQLGLVTGGEHGRQLEHVDELAAPGRAAVGLATLDRARGEGHQVVTQLQAGGPHHAVERGHRRDLAARLVGREGGVGGAGALGQLTEGEAAAGAGPAHDGGGVHGLMVSDRIPEGKVGNPSYHGAMPQPASDP